MSNASCLSSHCIYIIHCSLCDSFYVGQTSRTIHERIREHIYAIKNNFIHRSDVASHFNTLHHNFYKHFEFFIFKKDIFCSNERHYIENDLIHIILNLSGKILNSFIPNIYLMKKTITFT
jgi:hypothetical protein